MIVVVVRGAIQGAIVCFTVSNYLCLHVCMSSNDERCTMANKVGVLAIVDIGGQPCTLVKIFGCPKILGGYVS